MKEWLDKVISVFSKINVSDNTVLNDQENITNDDVFGKDPYVMFSLSDLFKWFKKKKK